MCWENASAVRRDKLSQRLRARSSESPTLPGHIRQVVNGMGLQQAAMARTCSADGGVEGEQVRRDALVEHAIEQRQRLSRHPVSLPAPQL